jgi:hypothetical protein
LVDFISTDRLAAVVTARFQSVVLANQLLRPRKRAQQSDGFPAAYFVSAKRLASQSRD